MHETMMTIENYKIALNNKKRLEYVASLYKLGIVNGEIFKYIINYKYKQKIEGIENDELKELYYIFGEIDNYLSLNNINANDNILNKLKEINKIILSLYSSYFSKDIKNPITADKIISSNDVVKLFPYCKEGEEDPFTTDPISGLDYNERKNVVNIILYDDISFKGKKKKVYYYCFDTIETYNYILGCIKNKINIKNLHTQNLFTDDELDEICDKIKKLTTKPIYHSHIDIKNAIAKQNKTYIYKNYLLELSFEEEKDYRNLKEYGGNCIIGNYNIYINLNFGGVILRVINTYDKATPPLLNKNNSFVLSLPIFYNSKKEVSQKDVYVKKFIIQTMQTSLIQGKYIEKSFFPYNNGRNGKEWNKIVNLPPFNYKLDDNAIDVYKNFKNYIETEKVFV